MTHELIQSSRKTCFQLSTLPSHLLYFLYWYASALRLIKKPSRKEEWVQLKIVIGSWQCWHGTILVLKGQRANDEQRGGWYTTDVIPADGFFLKHNESTFNNSVQSKAACASYLSFFKPASVKMSQL